MPSDDDRLIFDRGWWNGATERKNGILLLLSHQSEGDQREMYRGLYHGRLCACG